MSDRVPNRISSSGFSRRSVALAALLCSTPAAQAAPGWDIVGLKLGMTEQQALAAIKAHSPNAQVTTNSLKFTFHDGAKQQETPSFTSGLIVRVPQTGQDGETIQVEFSAPPTGQRVISLRRTLSSYANPPALERMIDSVAQKYGKPNTQSKYGIGQITTQLGWAEANRKPCGKLDKGLLLPPVSQTPDSLRWYDLQQKNGLAPANASECSGVLQVKLTTKAGGSSVVTMEFQMTDPGYGVPAMQATKQWLADLEAEARKVRLDSGKAPKL
ncbi:hypothetical protein [Steroidobacter sp.]|uniref:hypothetical protein n=1 Tax=Steroidobacter sp. TaxID=1978227 RepID=UPI001A56D5B8|nr:hypothetical protein [Steroidobacter sp.]MBL8264909.1 hypothetical protein [Steroidobacter sp.]